MSEYTTWIMYKEPILFEQEGINLTVLGERYNIWNGRRQHVILEDTILDYRNAEWFNIEEI